jgi:hypothetical protein
LPHLQIAERSATGEQDVSENPIQHLLDERGFPWRESQATLISRAGEGPDPWFNRDRIVFVDSEPPLLPGLLRPLHFEPSSRDNPSMPPLELWGWAWSSRRSWWRSRAIRSLDMVRESLEAALGPPAPDHTSNTRNWCWRFGPASIEIFSFPPLLAWRPTGDEIADRRDPRVDASCWVKLVTGYRPACPPHERAWIEAFEPTIVLPERGASNRIGVFWPQQDVLEYVREPFPGFERTIDRIGRTADEATLIFGSDQLYVVPVEHVDHVHVCRITPARGSGYASMTLACRGAFGERPIRLVTLARHADWDGLDELAARVAGWLGIPCVLGEPEPDY